MLRGVARQASEEVPMPSVPTAKVLAPGEGQTIMLFGVRFDDKVTGPTPAASWPPSRSPSRPRP
jgi:hypothetical protein